ncbi:DUF2690 domain-containing protein [Halosaccharopolyspora lacisalsi]|nr:DUF2690 domain-containing protein [Halosaccharopolyspora lacisalsi]
MLFLQLVAAQPAQAAGCYDGTCTGKDPEAMGCAADAVTVDRLVNESAIFELRYSAACHANWGRYVNGGAGSPTQTNLDGVPPEPHYPPYTFDIYTYWAGGSKQHPFWTPMGAGRDATRVCGRYKDGAVHGWNTWYCTEYH